MSDARLCAGHAVHLRSIIAPVDDEYLPLGVDRSPPGFFELAQADMGPQWMAVPELPWMVSAPLGATTIHPLPPLFAWESPPTAPFADERELVTKALMGSVDSVHLGPAARQQRRLSELCRATLWPALRESRRVLRTPVRSSVDLVRRKIVLTTAPVTVDKNRAILHECFGDSDEEDDPYTFGDGVASPPEPLLVVRDFASAQPVPESTRVVASSRHQLQHEPPKPGTAHGDIAEGTSMRVQVHEAEVSEEILKCISILKAGHDVIAARSGSSGEGDFWSITALSPDAKTTEITSALLAIRRAAWLALNCGVHASANFLKDNGNHRLLKPLSSRLTTCARVTPLGTSFDHPWAPRAAALVSHILYSCCSSDEDESAGAKDEGPVCCVLVCPKPGVPSIMRALGSIQANVSGMSVTAMLDPSRPLAPEDLAPSGADSNLHSVVIVTDPNQVASCTALVTAAVVVGELRAGSSWSWARGADELHHLLVTRPGLTKSHKEFQDGSCKFWLGDLAAEYEVLIQCHHNEVRTGTHEKQSAAKRRTPPFTPTMAPPRARFPPSQRCEASELPQPTLKQARIEQFLTVPAVMPDMDPQGHLQGKAAPAQAAARSPSLPPAVMAANDQLGETAPEIHAWLVTADLPGISLIDRCMPPGEILCLDSRTCVCFAEPANATGPAVEEATAHVLRQAAARYSTCIFLVKLREGGVEPDPGLLPRMQAWAHRQLGLDVVARFTRSISGTCSAMRAIIAGCVASGTTGILRGNGFGAGSEVEIRLGQVCNPVVACMAVSVGIGRLARELDSGRLPQLLPNVSQSSLAALSVCIANLANEGYPQFPAERRQLLPLHHIGLGIENAREVADAEIPSRPRRDGHVGLAYRPSSARQAPTPTCVGTRNELHWQQRQAFDAGTLYHDDGLLEEIQDRHVTDAADRDILDSLDAAANALFSAPLDVPGPRYQTRRHFTRVTRTPRVSAPRHERHIDRELGWAPDQVMGSFRQERNQSSNLSFGNVGGQLLDDDMVGAGIVSIGAGIASLAEVDSADIAGLTTEPESHLVAGLARRARPVELSMDHLALFTPTAKPLVRLLSSRRPRAQGDRVDPDNTKSTSAFLEPRARPLSEKPRWLQDELLGPKGGARKARKDTVRHIGRTRLEEL